MKKHLLTKTASYLIICFALVALFSGSCKKEDDGEDDGEGDGNGYKITLKVDGVLWEFENQDFPPFGNFYDDGKTYVGAFAATGRASSIGFSVYDTKPIVVKKDYSGYVFTQVFPPNAAHYNLIEGSVLSFADGQLSYSTQSITNPTVHVQITEITAIAVRGTFSGTLKSQNGKPDITVSEGKFYVKLKDPTN